MKHILVIGGTGMLSTLCSTLANDWNIVSVIGRNEERHKRIIHNTMNTENVESLIVDYSDHFRLKEVLLNSIQLNGQIDVVISWMDSQESFKYINDLIAKHTESYQLFHVRGSRRYFEDEQVQIPNNAQYRKVFLGFILTENGSRWLTNEEISMGVYEAMKLDAVGHVVGTIEPYEKRPGY